MREIRLTTSSGAYGSNRNGYGHSDIRHDAMFLLEMHDTMFLLEMHDDALAMGVLLLCEMLGGMRLDGRFSCRDAMESQPSCS